MARSDGLIFITIPKLAPVIAIRARKRGFRVFVADLMEDEAFSPDTVPIDEPIAILMGAELTGVSDQARALADGAVCVPMHGLTESLNVSVAAACILQRVTERRRIENGGGDLPLRRDKKRSLTNGTSGKRSFARA